MKSIMFACLLAAALAVPAFGEKWDDLTDEQIEKIIEKRDFPEILKIQKNSAKGKGAYADFREQRLIETLIKSRDFELLELLLKNGLPTNYSPGYYDYSILNFCLPLGDKKGDYEMFKFLLPHCAITSIEISTIVFTNSLDMFKLLVAAKINLDRAAEFYCIAGGPPCPYYPSLFSLAVAAKAYEIAKLIHQAHPGLNLNLPAYAPDYELEFHNPEGRPLIANLRTALDDALEDGDRAMIDWLKERHARTFTEIVPGLFALDPERYTQARAKSTTDRLRVRESNDLRAKVAGYVEKGEEVPVLSALHKNIEIDGIKSYWYLIRAKNQVFGWVFGGYLNFQTGK